ncbi:MAG: carboxypeptidase regulatory-like domain-containing protein [Alphaproteobacteria bacterium]|nr:carboxypeptidase regulatory-like domain-containing protein [Alphaproteobacteria bacterium]
MHRVPRTALVSLVLVGSVAHAQPTGVLRVTVVDEDGLEVPLTEVHLTGDALGDAERVATTDAAGVARFPDLPVGAYAVRAQRQDEALAGGRDGLQVVETRATHVEVQVASTRPAPHEPPPDTSVSAALAALHARAPSTTCSRVPEPWALGDASPWRTTRATPLSSLPVELDGGGATTPRLITEVGRCPWAPDHLLLRVTVQSGDAVPGADRLPAGTTDAALQLALEPARVRRHRVVGHDLTRPLDGSEPLRGLGSGAASSFLVELDPRPGPGRRDAGEVALTVPAPDGGEPVRVVATVDATPSTPSEAFAWEAAVAAVGLRLRGDADVALDWDALEALVAEARGTADPELREAFAAWVRRAREAAEPAR